MRVGVPSRSGGDVRRQRRPASDLTKSAAMSPLRPAILSYGLQLQVELSRRAEPRVAVMKADVFIGGKSITFSGSCTACAEANTFAATTLTRYLVVCSPKASISLEDTVEQVCARRRAEAEDGGIAELVRHFAHALLELVVL